MTERSQYYIQTYKIFGESRRGIFNFSVEHYYREVSIYVELCKMSRISQSRNEHFTPGLLVCGMVGKKLSTMMGECLARPTRLEH